MQHLAINEKLPRGNVVSSGDLVISRSQTKTWFAFGVKGQRAGEGFGTDLQTYEVKT